MLIYNHMVVDSEFTSSQIDSLFHALADPTRRDILRLTIDDGYSVSILATRYSFSFAAIQKHVAVLERAVLVTKERRGREQIVHANGPTIAQAIGLLDQYKTLWTDRADRIAQVLQTANSSK